MTDERLKNAADTIARLRGEYLFNHDEIPDIDAVPMVAHHFISALSHLELAVQEFQIARLHYIQDLASRRRLT